MILREHRAASVASRVHAQTRPRRIGFLLEATPAPRPRINAFKAGMRELVARPIEGKDYVIEQRSAQSDLTRLPALAAELPHFKVDLCCHIGHPIGHCCAQSHRDIPIPITTTGDPIDSGLCRHLRAPGGNVTGLRAWRPETFTPNVWIYYARFCLICVVWGCSTTLIMAAMRWVSERFESDCRKKVQPHLSALRCVSPTILRLPSQT